MIKKIIILNLAFIAIGVTARGQVTHPVNGSTDPKHILYAITNARIYNDYQTVIDSAVLLFKDGWILQAGKNLTVPADAAVFDAKGKTIYPAFVEIFGDYGLPEIKKRKPGNDGPQLTSATKGAFHWNQAMHPEYEAHQNFSFDEKKANELRQLGFGAVNSLYKDGISRGSSVLVLLSNEKENDLVLLSKASANYAFDKGSSTQDYPSSLMGSVALIRQTYYDAKWYSEGGYKKEYNISLEKWNQLQSLPQVFEAGDKQNVLRAAAIGNEFGVKYIVKSAGDEYQRLDEIKNAGVQLIVPVNFPEAYDVSDAYDALNITLGEMKHWELAPSNLSFIEKSGIPFAITASDLKDKSMFWKNIRETVDRGLPEPAALKALTFTPAAMLSSENKIGSLKPGMKANFLIVQGNIFKKEAVIVENWVNGKRYTVQDIPEQDLRGNYTLKIQDRKFKMKVEGESHKPAASVLDDSAMTRMNMEIAGQQISLQFELKKSTPKGIYRLNGRVIGWQPVQLIGQGQYPDGKWFDWSASFDSVFIPTAKADSARTIVDKPGSILFPNMAYGFEKLPEAKTYLVKNATVWTNEKEGIVANTDVLFADGKIKSVGKNLNAPGAEIIDGTNLHLTSGIIDEHSHIAASGSVNEGAQSSSAEVRIGDIIDADDIQIYRQLAGGVTSSHILHGSANAIGGQTQLIKLRWGESPEKLKFREWPGFIKFALGENVKQSNWGDNQVIRFPQTRMGVEQVYVDYFTRAKEYKQSWNKYNNSKTKKTGDAPRRDLELDALVEILDAKRFITCHSYHQSEINMLMHVADSFGFKVNTFTHILEGYKVADKMKKHSVAGASSFSDWWAYKMEVYEAIPYNGAIMHKSGLNVSYNSDDAEMARRLNQEAAKAVMYGGVPEEEAWKFVTLNPAKMLHVDQFTGSIKEGKSADLVLWNDNPLSIYAKPLMTFVDGKKYFDHKQDQEMRKSIQAERARLVQKMIEAKNKGAATQKPVARPQVLKHCLDEEVF